MLLPIIYLALALQTELALPKVVDTAPSLEMLIRRNRDEAYLLNRRIPAEALRNLLVWSSSGSEWRPPKKGKEPAAEAKVRVLHLWGTFCPPCEREFPALQKIIVNLETTHSEKVRCLFIAHTDTGSEAMTTYLEKHHGQIPLESHFRDNQGQLVAPLLSGLPSGTLSWPTTLLIDKKGVIRQAFVGPITMPEDRRNELADAVERLVKVL